MDGEGIGEIERERERGREGERERERERERKKERTKERKKERHNSKYATLETSDIPDFSWMFSCLISQFLFQAPTLVNIQA